MQSEEFIDTARMLENMSPTLQLKFMREKPAILAAHDWLTEEQWKAEHKTVPFNLDNPLCRRLAMQAGNIKFFLPETSMDLYKAGKKLHNCVGAYVNQVLNHQSQIVFVSDHKGGLVCCIELQGKRLIQAKLFANRLVSTNPQLNRAVVEWAEKLGIEWRGCGDVKDPEKIKELPTPEVVAV